MMSDKAGVYSVWKAEPEPPKGPVKEKSIVMRKESSWLYDEENKGKIRLATILLSSLNFGIETRMIENSYGKPLSTIHEEPEHDNHHHHHNHTNDEGGDGGESGDRQHQQQETNGTESNTNEDSSDNAGHDNIAYVNDSP